MGSHHGPHHAVEGAHRGRDRLDRLQKTAESAEVAGIGALEMAKEAAGKPSLKTPT